jgi:hypothetical protein
MEVEFGRFQKDVWATSPLRNKTIFTNSEGKLSRHIGFGRKIWLSFDKKRGMMLLYLHEKGRRKHCLVCRYFWQSKRIKTLVL